MVVLETPRLLLRHFEPADLDPLFALYRDPEIRRYYPDGVRTREQTREELEAFLHGHRRRPELGLWATIDRASAVARGFNSAHNSDMSRYVIAADIAGRPTLSTAGSDRMTAAAVAVRARLADEVRALAKSLPKWRDANEAVATQAIEQIERGALSVGIASMTKPPGAWEEFFAAAKPLQDKIVAQDRSPAGFVKPANVVKFVLLGHAYTFAGAQAVNVDREPHIKDLNGLDLIECTIVCDTEIEGEENLDVFRSLWAASD